MQISLQFKKIKSECKKKKKHTKNSLQDTGVGLELGDSWTNFYITGSLKSLLVLKPYKA